MDKIRFDKKVICAVLAAFMVLTSASSLTVPTLAQEEELSWAPISLNPSSNGENRIIPTSKIDGWSTQRKNLKGDTTISYSDIFSKSPFKEKDKLSALVFVSYDCPNCPEMVNNLSNNNINFVLATTDSKKNEFLSKYDKANTEYFMDNSITLLNTINKEITSSPTSPGIPYAVIFQGTGESVEIIGHARGRSGGTRLGEMMKEYEKYLENKESYAPDKVQIAIPKDGTYPSAYSVTPLTEGATVTSNGNYFVLTSPYQNNTWISFKLQMDKDVFQLSDSFSLPNGNIVEKEGEVYKIPPSKTLYRQLFPRGVILRRYPVTFTNQVGYSVEVIPRKGVKDGDSYYALSDTNTFSFRLNMDEQSLSNSITVSYTTGSLTETITPVDDVYTIDNIRTDVTINVEGVQQKPTHTITMPKPEGYTIESKVIAQERDGKQVFTVVDGSDFTFSVKIQSEHYQVGNDGISCVYNGKKIPFTTDGQNVYTCTLEKVSGSGEIQIQGIEKKTNSGDNSINITASGASFVTPHREGEQYNNNLCILAAYSADNSLMKCTVATRKEIGYTISLTDVGQGVKEYRFFELDQFGLVGNPVTQTAS